MGPLVVKSTSQPSGGALAKFIIEERNSVALRLPVGWFPEREKNFASYTAMMPGLFTRRLMEMLGRYVLVFRRHKTKRVELFIPGVSRKGINAVLDCAWH